MNFSSDAMADFEGLLEVNRKICQQQMAEKASPTLPTNCAALPIMSVHFWPKGLRFSAFFVMINADKAIIEGVGSHAWTT